MVFSTSLPETGTAAFNPALTDLAVGETVIYRITATLPQATLDDFSITDLLPAGLAPVSAAVVSIGSALSGTTVQPGDPGIVAGQTISFAFGTVVNAGGTDAIGPEDTIVVEVTALVRDIASNVAGALLTNTAATGFVIGGRAGEETDTARSVEVVAPELAVTKTVNHPTGDAGDVFTYTVTIAHAGNSSAPPSTSSSPIRCRRCCNRSRSRRASARQRSTARRCVSPFRSSSSATRRSCSPMSCA